MELEQPIYQQPVRSKGIEIGRDVWLGAHVGIKDGVKIADEAIIGMNSMVTKDVEARNCRKSGKIDSISGLKQ